MGLYLLGLKDILLTDISPIMHALKYNMKRDKQTLGKNLKIAQLHWGNGQQIRALNPPFDVILAADVVYIEGRARHLVKAMEELMKDDGFALLGYQVRSPEAHKLFWELVEVGFSVEKMKHEDLDPEYAYEETDVCILRKKMKV